MKQIFNELVECTPVFVVGADGTESVTWRPPTSKELRAARAIQALYNYLTSVLEEYAKFKEEYERTKPTDQNLHPGQEQASNVDLDRT